MKIKLETYLKIKEGLEKGTLTKIAKKNHLSSSYKLKMATEISKGVTEMEFDEDLINDFIANQKENLLRKLDCKGIVKHYEKQNND